MEIRIIKLITKVDDDKDIKTAKEITKTLAAEIVKLEKERLTEAADFGWWEDVSRPFKDKDSLNNLLIQKVTALDKELDSLTSTDYEKNQEELQVKEMKALLEQRGLPAEQIEKFVQNFKGRLPKPDKSAEIIKAGTFAIIPAAIGLLDFTG